MADHEAAYQAGFGRAESIHQDAVGAEVRPEELDIPVRRAIPLEPDDPDRWEVATRHEASEEGWYRVVDGDLLARDPLRRRTRGRTRGIAREDRGTIEERTEHAGDGAAESAGLQQRHPVVGRNPQTVGVAHDVVEDVAMGVDDALRLPGGSGCEVHVCRR